MFKLKYFIFGLACIMFMNLSRLEYFLLVIWLINTCELVIMKFHLGRILQFLLQSCYSIPILDNYIGRILRSLSQSYVLRSCTSSQS
jgi:uncharacterized membrane protein YjjP (DUF1212 family)